MSDDKNQFDRITPPRRANPIVASMQFASLTKANGGATMNLKTGRILQEGEPGYVVGGEPNDKGERIPTVSQTELSPAEVIGHRERLRSETSSPRANLGSWQDSKRDNVIDVDASGTYADRKASLRLANFRGEKAIWDNGRAQEIGVSRGPGRKKDSDDE